MKGYKIKTKIYFKSGLVRMIIMIKQFLKIIKDEIKRIVNNLPKSGIIIFLKLAKIFLKFRLLKIKILDLTQINEIKTKKIDYLSNPKLLESELLPKLGFNDESISLFHKELHTYCGRGLLSWQYPNQFSKYLVQLSKLKIETYLEIGVHYGGTFIITIEYLNKFHPIKEAVGIDIFLFPFLKLYKKMNPKVVHFMQIDSQSSQFKEFINNYPGFDLVLIDGNHEEDACRNDFETVKDKANIVVFHDIIDNYWTGVNKVWNEINGEYSNEYNFFSYIDQYDSITKKTGKSFIGIGVAIKKDYLQRIGFTEVNSNR